MTSVDTVVARVGSGREKARAISMNVYRISLDKLRSSRFPVYVIDTSAFSHAFEGLAPALVWAYAASGRRRWWGAVVESFMRRQSSTRFMRKFLLGCGIHYLCVVSEGVLREVMRTPYFRREVVLFFSSPQAIENEFKDMFPGYRKSISGFGRAFAPKIFVVRYPLSKKEYEMVKEVENRMGQERKLPGKPLDEVDVTNIVLAKNVGAELITGDKRQYLVGSKYGVKIKYTLR